MKVITFYGSKSNTYCCNFYLVLGTWNALSDINTLVDVGTNDFVIGEVARIASTGVGKNPVEQVIITHNHFDHAGGLKHVIKKFQSKSTAFNNSDEITRTLSNGENVIMGDSEFEVIHVPAHSNDSICLYSKKDRILFSGDTPINIKTPGGSYTSAFVTFLKKIVRMDIDIIYSGHDDPLTHDVNGVLKNTLSNVEKSVITA